MVRAVAPKTQAKILLIRSKGRVWANLTPRKEVKSEQIPIERNAGIWM